MSLNSSEGLSFGEINAEIVQKLEAAFGEITDNVLSTIPTLPREVKDTLLAAQDNSEVERAWNAYLQSVVAVMPK